MKKDTEIDIMKEALITVRYLGSKLRMLRSLGISRDDIEHIKEQIDEMFEILEETLPKVKSGYLKYFNLTNREIVKQILNEILSLVSIDKSFLSILHSPNVFSDVLEACDRIQSGKQNARDPKREFSPFILIYNSDLYQKIVNQCKQFGKLKKEKIPSYFGNEQFVIITGPYEIPIYKIPDDFSMRFLEKKQDNFFLIGNLTAFEFDKGEIIDIKVDEIELVLLENI